MVASAVELVVACGVWKTYSSVKCVCSLWGLVVFEDIVCVASLKWGCVSVEVAQISVSGWVCCVVVARVLLCWFLYVFQCLEGFVYSVDCNGCCGLCVGEGIWVCWFCLFNCDVSRFGGCVVGQSCFCGVSGLIRVVWLRD